MQYVIEYQMQILNILSSPVWKHGTDERIGGKCNKNKIKETLVLNIKS